MNNLDSSESTDFEDGTPIHYKNLGQSLENNSSPEERFTPELLCLKPGCETLKFVSEVEHRNHILTHITLPTVKVPRLNIRSSSPPKTEPLKVRLKLTSQAGSEERAFEDFLASLWNTKSKESADQRSNFSDELYQSNLQCVEVVPSKTYLSGPGGLYSVNGIDNGLKTELFENSLTSQKEGSSARKPIAEIELDDSASTTAQEEREGRTCTNNQEEEQNTYCDEDDLENDLEEEEEEDDDDELEEDDEEEEQVEESGGGETETSLTGARTTPPLSPTPSEVLRPVGYLAPEQLVDDDSCYPRSPPVSPSRMVEMNGTTSAVSGSDNDSGLSRSPATFSGGTGGGSGGEEDSSVPPGFNWDELVEESTGHGSNDSNASNENGRSNGRPAGDVNERTSEMDGSNGSSNILENDPLMLPENSVSAEGEQENLNLLQNLTADPLHAEVDRGAGGETEYMSLDRLGEASFCCEVCGEHAQDRRVLEEHRVMAGHYKCLIMPECGSIVWGTAAELAAHQSSIHGVSQSQVQQSQRSPQQRSTPPRTSPQGAPGTPPVQQLAQQVQRLPIPQQTGYQPMPGGQYPPQQMPQMGQMMPQMGPLPGQMPQRRPPIGYRMPMPVQPPYGPGSPNQQQPGYSGAIQPRPLNSLVAQQPRGQGPIRLPPGAVMPPRGMVPTQGRGQKRPGPGPQGVGRGMVPPAAKQRRAEGMMPPQQDNGPGKKSDAKAVANILATRGITVTPAGATRGGPPPPMSQVRQRQNMLAPAPPPPVTTLNLNSAISIIPTTGTGNNRQQNNSGFAVPQVRSAGRQPIPTNVERPPRPPTVDLTGEGPHPPPGSTRLQMGPTLHRGRGRPSNISRTTCQICDKVFASAEMLNQHMAMHRGPGKLPFRCNLCNAQYPTNQGLQQHRQTYHKESIGMSAPLAPGEEMVIPLIDLKQPGVASRLSSLGIHHCIPLSGLGNQANGYFSLPVVSIDGSRPSAAGNLRSLGASGVLSIGPIKLVPK